MKIVAQAGSDTEADPMLPTARGSPRGAQLTSPLTTSSPSKKPAHQGEEGGGRSGRPRARSRSPRCAAGWPGRGLRPPSQGTPSRRSTPWALLAAAIRPLAPLTSSSPASRAWAGTARSRPCRDPRHPRRWRSGRNGEAAPRSSVRSKAPTSGRPRSRADLRAERGLREPQGHHGRQEADRDEGRGCPRPQARGPKPKTKVAPVAPRPGVKMIPATPTPRSRSCWLRTKR